MKAREYFNLPMMSEQEYSSWINRITSTYLLEDIVFSCDANLGNAHFDHYYPPDMRVKKRLFYVALKKAAGNRIAELTLLSNHTDTN